MNDSVLGPHVKTARGYLDAVRAWLGGDRGVQQAAGYGLRMLWRILDEVRGEIDGWEMAELAAVYDALALLIAEALDLDSSQAFNALAVLCSDAEALRLTRGQPEPIFAQMQLLRSQVIWITVTYGSAAHGRGWRLTEIAFKNAAGDLRSTKSTVDFRYDDLPKHVRGRMTGSGQRAIRYQLYPAPESRLS